MVAPDDKNIIEKENSDHERHYQVMTTLLKNYKSLKCH
jgi:hypothetical protein